MKRLYFLLILIASLSCVPVLTGCDDLNTDEEEWMCWDFPPYSFNIDIVDEDGTPLLDPTTSEGMALASEIIVEYNDKQYTFSNKEEVGKWPDNSSPDAIKSRALPAVFRGLIMVPYAFDTDGQKVKRPSMMFGEFARDDTYTLDFTIIWPDGLTDKIHVEHKFRWKKKNDPEIEHKYYLNGVMQNTHKPLLHILER